MLERMAPYDTLLTPEEVARFLRISPAELKRWRNAKAGPPFVRLGHRTVRYSQQGLREWLAEQ